MCREMCVLKDMWEWYPGVGWFISILGFLAAAVALLRDPKEISRREKAAWIAVMFALLFLELRSISLDRAEQTKNFTAIALGLEQSIDQSTAAVRGLQSLIESNARIENRVQSISAGFIALSKKAQTQKPPSGEALVRFTSELTGTIRDLPTEWRASIFDTENMTYEALNYARPPLKDDEKRETEKKAAEKIEQINGRYKASARTLLLDAESLRLLLLAHIPVKDRTAEDSSEAPFLQEVMRKVANAKVPEDSSEDLRSLANYLDTLAVRAKNASAG